MGIKIFKIVALITLSVALNLNEVRAYDSNDAISKQQVENDVKFLADDSLEGRANFSKGIEKAAQYIEKKFKQIGLRDGSGLIKGIDGYRQSIKLVEVKNTSASATINGQKIDKANIAVTGKINAINWNEESEIKRHYISKKDNIRQVLSKINRKGSRHLVLISNVHKATFGRYRQYFQRAKKIEKSEFEINKNKQVVVMVLIDDSSFTLKKLNTFKISAQFDVSEKSIENVIGILPGKKKQSEVVIFSAHYDHLGTLKDTDGVAEHKVKVKTEVNRKRDTIYNGANDDASGTAAVINLANYYAKKNDNQRTLIFIAFAGEEIGLFGSRYFSNQIDPNKVVAMINLEMIGKKSPFENGQLWMTGVDRSNLFEILNNNIKNMSNKIQKDPYPNYSLFYRSDNASLARQGVPAHSFSTTQIDKDKDYHQVSDEISTIDFDNLTKAITTIAQASQTLVDGSKTPSRVDKNKVKSVNRIY